MAEKVSKYKREFPLDPLKELPGEYWENGNTGRFMEKASIWIVDFCRYRLNRDPDIVGDFYLYFFENVEKCLEKYKSRQHLPFTGYLASYLRHEYLNFMRPKRRDKIYEVSVEEIFTANSSSLFFGANEVAPVDQSLLDSMHRRIEKLAEKYRLPIKLYFGFELNCTDLRFIVNESRDVIRATEFLMKYNIRKEKLRKQVNRMRNRAAYLNYLIHSAQDRSGMKANAMHWRKWKQKITDALERHNAVFSHTDIAELLEVNKSTISRRIERGLKQIKGG